MNNPNIANPIASPTVTTTYTVTVTNPDGCTSTDQVTISINGSINIGISPNTTICENNSTTLNATGGINYVWSPTSGLNNPNIANPIATPTATTTYCVTVTSADGCTATACVTVTVVPGPEVIACPDKFICNGESVRLTVNGGVSWLWTPTTGLNNPFAPAPVASPTVTTTYTVVGTGVNGCMDSDEVTVFVSGTATADAGPDQTICTGSSTTLNASGGLSYLWTPVTGLSNPNFPNPTASPTVTTTYTVEVINSEGCKGTDEVIITVNNGPTANAGVDATICLGNSTQLNATGGVTYSWSPSTGLNNNLISNPIASPTTTTTYTVVVTDADGCTNTDQVTVTVKGSATANAGNDATICAGTSTQLNATGGVTFNWSPTTGLSNPNIANPIASPTLTTTYTVTVTNAEGCTNSDQVIITIGEDAIANAGDDATICVGTSTQLNATGGVTYLWSPTTGLNNSNIANPIANPTITTTYTVTVTNAEDCSDTDEVIITINNGPTANAGSDVTICSSNSTQLNATGGVSYSWSPTADLSNPNIANPTASPSTTTTFEVTVTDATGCTGTDQVTVTVTQAAEVVACEDKNICEGDSTMLSVTTGVVYQWSPANTLSDPTIGTPVASPLFTTTYTVTVTDANGCTGEDDVVVNVGAGDIANAGIDAILCVGTTKQLEGSGGVTYSWSPTTGLNDPNIANPILTASTTTTYTLTVTNNFGCTDTDELVITVSGDDPVNAGADVGICEGESIQLNATGGTNYTWSPSIGLSDILIANPVANPTLTTIYTVTSTTPLGCTTSDQVTVTVHGLPTVTPTIIAPTCCNNDGSISLAVAGGSGTFTYVWTPNVSTTNTATDLAEGNYKVVITDSLGCGVIAIIDLEMDCQCIPIMTDRVVCVNEGDTIGQFCFPVKLENIGDYEFTIPGATIIPDHGCDFENLTAYSYSLLTGAGNDGPYKIDNWTVNGLTFNGMVNNMDELTDWMNSVDPTGNWTHNSPVLIIMGGNPISTYGDMKITHQVNWIETTLNPNSTGVAQGTLVEVPMGNADSVLVLIRNIRNCCEETVVLKRCDMPAPCMEEIIVEDSIEIIITDCNETGKLCIPIVLEDITSYSIYVNGEGYTGGFMGCDFDTLFAYTYFTMPNQGAVGPYMLRSWTMDGQTYSGQFNNIADLVSMMNVWDPNGNWMQDEASLTIQGGLPSSKYGTMDIEQINTGAFAILELNTNLLPMGTQLAFSIGTKEVVIINNTTGCQDTLE